MTLRVTVWNENVHERTEPEVMPFYPQGIHGAIADGLREVLGDDVVVRTATLDQPGQGLAEDVLAATDVLIWWGHLAHDEVDDEVVDRVQRHVLGGMGLIVLHSGHFSRIFIGLMGTTCSLTWRDDGDPETIWTVSPGHPIAQGVPHPLFIPAHETYGEFFDIPAPDELVFITSANGGEVFRSGAAYRRGKGRVFYFAPGDQKYPIYLQPEIRLVIANAARWARRVDTVPPEVAHATRRD